MLKKDYNGAPVWRKRTKSTRGWDFSLKHGEILDCAHKREVKVLILILLEKEKTSDSEKPNIKQAFCVNTF